MSKKDAIWGGIKLGIICMEIIYAVHAFKQGNVGLGIFFIACAIIIVLINIIPRIIGKPRIEIRRVSEAEAEELEKMLGNVVRKRLYSEDVIKHIIDLIDKQYVVQDNLDYAKGFNECKRKCMEIIKDECDIKEE